MSGSVVVVGAGIAGLACAWRLREAGVSVTLLEASERAGGVVGTLEQGGFLFELGPNTVPASAPAYSALVHDLGLADQVILSNDAAKKRLLFHGGEAVALPDKPGGLVRSPLLSFGAKLRMLREPLRRRKPHPSGAPEPTLQAFFEERIGYEPTRTLLGAFVRGVYGGEVDRLGARSAFPALWDMVQEHGSILRGFRARKKAARNSTQAQAPTLGPRGSLASFPGGMQTLIDALQRALGDVLRFRKPVARIERQAQVRGAPWAAVTKAGARFPADHIVLALPANAAAELVIDDELVCESLAGVEYAAMTIVHMGFANEADLPLAFGCLVPPDAAAQPAAPRLLGVLFPTRIFDGRAPSGSQAASCFYRTSDLGSRDPVRTALEDLARLGIGRGDAPSVSQVLHWPRAIPQYTPGHDERMSAVERQLNKTHAGLHLAASYIGGVSVEAVAGRARTIADRICAQLAIQP